MSKHNERYSAMHATALECNDTVIQVNGITATIQNKTITLKDESKVTLFIITVDTAEKLALSTGVLTQDELSLFLLSTILGATKSEMPSMRETEQFKAIATVCEKIMANTKRYKEADSVDMAMTAFSFVPTVMQQITLIEDSLNAQIDERLANTTH